MVLSQNNSEKLVFSCLQYIENIKNCCFYYLCLATRRSTIFSACPLAAVMSPLLASVQSNLTSSNSLALSRLQISVIVAFYRIMFIFPLVVLLAVFEMVYTEVGLVQPNPVRRKFSNCPLRRMTPQKSPVRRIFDKIVLLDGCPPGRIYL